MSNTATTAMMLPVALGVLTAAGIGFEQQERKFATEFLLMLAYAAAVGGLMTPVGSPPNLITIALLERLVGIRIDFLTWMMIPVPIAGVIGALLFPTTAWLFPAPRTAGTVMEYDLGEASKRSGGSRRSAIVPLLPEPPWFCGSRPASSESWGSPSCRCLAR